jgi:cytochrome c biogenesis protein CcmG/thiol:disulfide interchange protein DsbE
MRNRLVQIAFVLAFLSVPCLPCPSAAQTMTAAAQRAAAPDFTLSDAKGKPITLSEYKGKVVLLDFWATWCTGCKIEIPWYMEFEKKYKRRGLASIGVAMDEAGWKTVTPYLKKKPINYPIVVGDPNFANAYKVESLPVTLLIDRRGRIADEHVGMVVKDSWEQEILTLLRER